MDDLTDKKVSMYNVILNICKENYDILSTLTPFVSVFSVFENKVNELEGWLVKQGYDTTGITVDKNDSRKALEQDAYLLSSALFAYSKDQGLETLALQVKYTPTGFATAEGQKLTGICHELLKVANEHLAGLEPYQVDAAWLTAFEGKITDFMNWINAPASAREERRKATEEANRLVKEINDWLRFRLDPLMELFAYKDRMVYGTYRNGRKTIKPAVEKPDLRGTVTDSEGKPLNGLKVKVAGTQRKSITTAKGNFRYMRIKNGSYTLLVMEGKKEIARKQVTVPMEGERVEIIVGSKD